MEFREEEKMEKIEWRKDKSYSMKKSPQILEVPKNHSLASEGSRPESGRL